MEYLKTNLIVTIIGLAITCACRFLFKKPSFPVWMFAIQLLWLVPVQAFYTLGLVFCWTVPLLRMVFHYCEEFGDNDIVLNDKAKCLFVKIKSLYGKFSNTKLFKILNS